ncbi:hypothetical protein GGI43DRAFT_291737 [Trichoderma evansii]
MYYRISGVSRRLSPASGRQNGPMSGRCWRGLPGETQLSSLVFFLSIPCLVWQCVSRKESCSSQGSLVRWQGRRNSIPLWRRASLPTGHGARRRRVGEPQQSKRLAANELRADTRTKDGVRAEYWRCSYLACVLPWGRTEGFFGESADEDIEIHAKVGAGIT